MKRQQPSSHGVREGAANHPGAATKERTAEKEPARGLRNHRGHKFHCCILYILCIDVSIERLTTKLIA
jgi:hypothetical protein